MKYDLIVIGSGPGGYVAAIRAAQLGMKVGVVERESLGGVCLNWGCIATKALLKSAQVYNYIKNATDFGIELENSKPNFEKVIARSREVAGSMSKGINFLFRKNKIDVLKGNGTLEAGKKVKVENDGESKVYEADHIIVATGGRSKELPNLEIDGKNIIGYREAIVLKEIPKKMIVVGAGAIGTEFAYFYHSMGSEVTMVEYMEQGLLPREDADISKELGKIFQKSGIEVLAGTKVNTVTESDNGLKVEVENVKKGNKETLDDRKSTRLNSSHVAISYAVFCLKKKNRKNRKKT